MQKHQRLFSVVLLTVVLSANSACKKVPFDHRNKYLGEWSFDVHYSSFTMNEGVLYDYSETYKGEIVYGEEKSNIIIKYAADKSIELVIDEDEMLSGFPTHYCSGSFKDKKNLDLYLRWGGLGGGTTHSMTGAKK